MTPTDTAQAEARLSRGLADLSAAEVAFAISKATYAQVIGEPPSQLERLRRLTACHRSPLPRRPRPPITNTRPSLAGYDVDMA